MKKNLFAIIAGLALILTGSNACAQNHQGKGAKEQPTPEQMAERRANRMKEQLSLTDAQAEQLYTCVLEKFKLQQAQQEAMRAATKSENARIKEILTPEQFAQWKEIQKARREKQGAQGAHKGQGAKGAKGAKDGKCAHCDKKGECPKGKHAAGQK